jgi:hypothetical protein
MHHVLFSFYNYHDLMSKIDIWQGIISNDNKFIK